MDGERSKLPSICTCLPSLCSSGFFCAKRLRCGYLSSLFLTNPLSQNQFFQNAKEKNSKGKENHASAGNRTHLHLKPSWVGQLQGSVSQIPPVHTIAMLFISTVVIYMGKGCSHLLVHVASIDFLEKSIHFLPGRLRVWYFNALRQSLKTHEENHTPQTPTVRRRVPDTTSALLSERQPCLSTKLFSRIIGSCSNLHMSSICTP